MKNRSVYKLWKIQVAEMDFFEFDLNDQNVGNTYKRFTDHLRVNVEKAMRGEAGKMNNIHHETHYLPENWWYMAIGVYDGKKVYPTEHKEILDDDLSSDYLKQMEEEQKNGNVEKEEEEETRIPAEILKEMGDAKKKDVYTSLMPVYTAIKENFDKRFKLFSWIFDHARYTAERDSIKALSGLMQALTGDSKNEIDRNYAMFRDKVKLDRNGEKNLATRVKIDKLKLTNPTKAQRLDEEFKRMRGEQKRVENAIPQNDDDEVVFTDDTEKEHHNGYTFIKDREPIKNEQFYNDVSVDNRNSEVSNMIYENDEVNKSTMSNSMD